jgi:hypothetical protein
MRYSGLLSLVAFIGVLIRFAVWIGLAIAIAALLAVLWKLVGSLDRRLGARDVQRAARRAELAATAARADWQNALFLAGDPHGLYGKYRPEIYSNG